MVVKGHALILECRMNADIKCTIFNPKNSIIIWQQGKSLHIDSIFQTGVGVIACGIAFKCLRCVKGVCLNHSSGSLILSAGATSPSTDCFTVLIIAWLFSQLSFDVAPQFLMFI